MPTNIDVNKVEFIPFAYEPRLVRGIGQVGARTSVRQPARIYKFVKSNEDWFKTERPELLKRFGTKPAHIRNLYKTKRAEGVLCYELFSPQRALTLGLAWIIKNQRLKLNPASLEENREVLEGHDLGYTTRSDIKIDDEVHKSIGDQLVNHSWQAASDPSTHVGFMTALETLPRIIAEDEKKPDDFAPSGLIGHHEMRKAGYLAIRTRAITDFPFEPSWQNRPADLYVFGNTDMHI